jgi:tellurite resistance protein TehA-like permease
VFRGLPDKPYRAGLGDHDPQSVRTDPSAMLAKPPRDEPDQRSIIVRLVANFPSSSFAFIMATGIISIAAALLDFGRIASLLLAVNSTAFFVLWILTFLRLIYFPLTVIADLRDPRRGPGFLTAVAGTNVLGDQISLLTSHQDIAAALWLGGCALWVGLIYCVFSALATRATKPSITAGLDGSWLLIVVAPQSSAILGAQIAGVFSSPQIVIFASLSLYLLGGAFYFVIITLIIYRWLFEPLAPEQLTPSYWINMGAAAITTLAGARLSSAVISDPVLAITRGYIIGETLLFWSVASWWIPLLAGLMVWRHLTHRVRLVYQFDYWSLVFPLGMYAAATLSFTRVIGAEFLAFVPCFFFWAAIATWCLTFFGMMRRLVGAVPILVGGQARQQRME